MIVLPRIDNSSACDYRDQSEAPNEEGEGGEDFYLARGGRRSDLPLLPKGNVTIAMRLPCHDLYIATDL